MYNKILLRAVCVWLWHESPMIHLSQFNNSITVVPTSFSRHHTTGSVCISLWATRQLPYFRNIASDQESNRQPVPSHVRRGFPGISSGRSDSGPLSAIKGILVDVVINELKCCFWYIVSTPFYIAVVDSRWVQLLFTFYCSPSFGRRWLDAIRIVLA